MIREIERETAIYPPYNKLQVKIVSVIVYELCSSSWFHFLLWMYAFSMQGVIVHLFWLLLMVLFDFQSMKLHNSAFTTKKSPQFQNAISDELEKRLKTWGKVSAITRHDVGGCVVM